MRVSGFTTKGHWTEMATISDASPSGVAFLLKHPVVKGTVLHLLLPLPKRFRSYDLGDPSYHVYALVRSARPDPHGVRVGVLFLGRNPPRNFEKEPNTLYLLPDDPMPSRGKERRQHTRLEVFVNLWLRREGDPIGSEERTIAENIGRGGARVMSALSVAPGDILVLTEVDGDFVTRAEVRNAYVGEDHIPRLCLRFVDAQAPDRLVSTA